MKIPTKNLSEVTTAQAKHICFLLNEHFKNLSNVSDSLRKIGVGIFIVAKDVDDSSSAIFIYNDGRVLVNWVDKKTDKSFRPVINAMLVTDYLKAQGYTFKVVNRLKKIRKKRY